MKVCLIPNNMQICLVCVLTFIFIFFILDLQRAVELNPKLVPHVLQFIDWHFRSFFRVPNATDVEGNFCVMFDKVVRTSSVNAYELQIQDNLGLLVQFVSHCLIKLEGFEIGYDVREIKRLLRLAVDKVITKELQFEEKVNVSE